MIRIVIAFAATVLLLPFAARAAELPVTGAHHRVVTHRVHRHAYAPRQHFGYYFGRWGRRSGGTARSWYGSTFVLAGGPWDRRGVVLAASPRGIAAIHCTEWRPDTCLAEPVVAPLAAAEPGWR